MNPQKVELCYRPVVSLGHGKVLNTVQAVELMYLQRFKSCLCTDNLMFLNGLYLYSTGTVLECTTELGCIAFYNYYHVDTKVHAIQYSSKVRAPLAGILKSFLPFQKQLVLHHQVYKVLYSFFSRDMIFGRRTIK